jgi:16S rRNA (adenine1518-N6/adenine1519-N6)-dimethyltransferase
VIEIGPGRGALTIPLAAACKVAGCRLIAIEKDVSLADGVATALAPMAEVEIIKGDALKLLPTTIAATTKTNKDYLIVGNIPYYITGKLLHIVSDMETKPRQCVFMVQREVAERICATAPTMNRLSASVQFWADVKTIAAVPKSDFTPPPKVDSAVILLSKKADKPLIDAYRYYQTVRTVFAQPRKTILNNISAIKKDIPKNETEALLKKLGVNPENRPQNLSVEEIIAIAGTMGITL